MRSLSSSLLVLALTFTVAHGQSTPLAAPAAPAPTAQTAPQRPAAPAQPTLPVPPAIKGTAVFTCGSAKSGSTALSATSLYSESAAGWDLQTAPKVNNGTCSSDKPFFFSIPVPEGNYRVRILFGGPADSVVTVRAEARRLMLEKVSVKANAILEKSFDVNVRVPEFTNPDGTANRVRLKQREIGNLNWDNKLTIEFNGTNPSFHVLSVTPLVGSRSEPVVYLAGDSTMVDQDVEPWASWGQMLPRFFLPGVVFANEAESGESATSFLGEQRFAKVMSVIKPGDYFFVQFAHNDQKIPNGIPRYIQIMTDFVNQVKAKGAIPVIVTAQNRDNFDADGHIVDTLGGYPQASRQIAADTKTALIDLNAMSKTMFEAMGKDGADHAFMKFKAGSYPGVDRDIADSTHFNNFGAYELARCITLGIRQNKLPFSGLIDPSVPDFDPAHPDAFASFSLPYSPPEKKEDVTAIPQANLK
jgi:lysophospholipase L1-like esterase